MPLYKAKVAGKYKDINFAPGEVIDVAETDAKEFGWDQPENAVMEAHTEPAPEAPAAAPETPVTPVATPEAPAPEQAPQTPAPDAPAAPETGVGEGGTQ